jgi:hypothetical protein
MRCSAPSTFILTARASIKFANLPHRKTVKRSLSRVKLPFLLAILLRNQTIGFEIMGVGCLRYV